MPMAFTRLEPHDVAGTNLLDGAALALDASRTGRDDQCLAQRMGVPGGAGARLEGNDGAADARGFL
jgi:hypothetical protein